MNCVFLAVSRLFLGDFEQNSLNTTLMDLLIACWMMARYGHPILGQILWPSELPRPGKTGDQDWPLRLRVATLNHRNAKKYPMRLLLHIVTL